MRLWRVSNHADLSGFGGTLASGRWHTAGRAAVYAADHPALAFLETLVHTHRLELPDTLQLLGIHGPDDSAWERLHPGDLPDGWAHNEHVTRAIGDAWLAEAKGLMLFVPTVIVPYAWNVLLNPGHAAARHLKIETIDRVPLDRRLA